MDSVMVDGYLGSVDIIQSGVREVIGMKLVIFTLALDSEPWIEKHLPIFNQLKVDWRWIIIHGAAMNQGSTSWCQPQAYRLSTDGTTEYLNSIKSPPESAKVIVKENPSWPSKDEMVNQALMEIEDDMENHELMEIAEPCVLMEIDSDEIHTAENIEKIVSLFESDPWLGAIKMPCRYFVGPDLICVGDNCWSNKADEWIRSWRFEPGMKCVTHEPPKFDRQLGRMMEKDEARKHDLTFDHFAYATEAQCKFKEQFYGYRGLVNQWHSLQQNGKWPVKLSRFFPFVNGETLVAKLT